MSAENPPMANTDRELFRETTDLSLESPGMSYYENSVFVTEDQRIGLNVDGHVYTRTIADWHRFASVESPMVPVGGDQVFPPRRFALDRDVDVSGVSGTGRVADGVLWPDGTASVRWRGEHRSIVFWDRGWESVEVIHGHGGATAITWLDGEA